METLRKRQYDRRNVAWEIAIFVGFALWGVFVNRDIHTSWLFIDDLIEWYTAQGENFAGYLRDGDPSHFRPILRVMQWFEVHLIDNHLKAIIPINLCILTVTTWVMYRFMKSLCGSGMISVLLAAAFECAEFSYYSVSQLLGIIESVPLFLGLMVCILLYGYMHGRSRWLFFAAIIFYVTACFIHERYMVLLPMFFYAVLIRHFAGCDGKSDGAKPATAFLWVEILAGVSAFACVQVLRYKALGTFVPAGTAGTMITETFSVKQAMVNVLQQLAYFLGIHTGPIHLCAIPWKDTAPIVKVMTVIRDAVIVYVIIKFFGIVTTKGRPMDSGRSRRYLTDAIFFAGFIIGYVAASSVTVRVELRWVYASWGMCCILLAYMAGAVMRERPELGLITKLAVCFAAFLVMLCSIYYRSGFKDVYLFEEQARRESLIDMTYGRYGDDIFTKNIYIIGNFYQVTEFEELHMLAPHQPLGQERSMNIIHVALPEQVPDPESGNTIVLYEDPVDDTYKVYEYAK